MHQKPEQISQAMNIKISTLSQMLRRPDFLEVHNKLKDKSFEGVDKTIESDARNIRQEIIDIQGASMDRLTSLLDSAASEGIKKDIAQDFLDRGGHTKAPEKAPQIQININPIEADVIATALHKEKQGRERLEKLEIRLAKPSKEVEHPALQSGDEPTD